VRIVSTIALFALAGCSTPAVRWTPPPAVGPKPLVLARAVLPRDAILETHLDENVATDTSKPGDRVTATVVTPVRGRDGRSLVPKDARVLLRVERLVKGKGARAPVIEIAPVGLVAPCGERSREQPIVAHARAEVQTVPEDHPGAEREKIRGGAIGGLFFGGLLMGLPGAGLGGTIGAGGGMASVIASRPVDGRLAAGAPIQIQLDSAVSLSALACVSPSYTRR
jgi:hypothetical protein